MEIRPFQRDDFEILASWFDSEASLVQWGGPLLTYPLSIIQMETMIKESQSVPPTRKCWMIIHDDVIIGHSQLAFDWRNGNATLGRVAVEPKHRGHGIAVPMLRLILREAFSYNQIFRLELNVYSFNEPAIRTYKSLGFQSEGIRREASLVGNERWDVCGMAILRREYLEKGSA
jgi:RimJ/RimL family protein N-acetyltransferase